MELTHRIVDGLSRPSIVLGQTELLEHASKLLNNGDVSWDVSALHPKNRPNTLDTSRSGWRIDGATRCGTCFFAVPLDLLPGLPPVRIFVFLPDQSDWPPALRICLEASLGVVLRDGAQIAQLGISKHLCLALDHHCLQHPGFLRRYQRLPFASRLVFENVAADPAEMRLQVVPNYHLESTSLSPDALFSSWRNTSPELQLPPVIDVSHLRLVKPIHDTVTVVEVNSQQISGAVIFKSAVDDVDHLYHELRTLLTVPPHPNVMPRPLAVVTKRVAFGGKMGVVGFLLPFFPSGSIRDILPLRQRSGALTTETKLEWCRQVASALSHVKNAGGVCYTDLRPDNVLLDDSTGEDRLVLCDFEQRGNWHEWCAPEVLYRHYVDNLRSTDPSPSDPRWAKLLHDYTQEDASSGGVSLENTAIGSKNPAWFALPHDEQETAMVYSLALFTYAVFEGLSGVQRNLNNKWPCEPSVEFPEFKLTPLKIEHLIRKYTLDGPGSVFASLQPPAAKRVIRVGSVLRAEAQDDSRDYALLVGRVLETAQEWWVTELDRAANFLQSDSRDHPRCQATLKDFLNELEKLTREGIDS